MNRRGFLGSILALSAAPAIVRADSLMRIVPRDVLVGSLGPVKFFDRELTDQEMWTEASDALIADACNPPWWLTDDDFDVRFIRPAVARLAKAIDDDFVKQFTSIDCATRIDLT